MHATAAVGAAAVLFRKIPRLPLRSASRAVAADGNSAYSMAMHVHSSSSEQSGSMDSQLFQAATNSVDVLWWTDHDARMDGIGYRDTVHFTSLTAEKGASGQGGAWIWTKAESGPVASSSGGPADSSVEMAPSAPSPASTQPSRATTSTARSRTRSIWRS